MERKDKDHFIEQKRSPVDIILEIENSLRPPLPEPPANASWVGKNQQELDESERLDKWNYVIQIQTIIAEHPSVAPGPEHPRYSEYQQAKREYEDLFSLKPMDLLREFNI